uniref:Uncharacterized protein n=1 Tax=Arundo donax TaxID=35708 RepID=A0A0A9DWG8_ARUDO
MASISTQIILWFRYGIHNFNSLTGMTHVANLHTKYLNRARNDLLLKFSFRGL